MLDETHIRLEAIHYVRQLRERWVAVPASELRHFTAAGHRVHLKGQQGIFKPAELSDPLSVTSTIDSPYHGDPIEGSSVLYDFLPPSREFENEGLKRCAELALPLIYFLQVRRRPNPEYAIFAPVYVVGWDDAARRFLIDLSEQRPAETRAPALTRQLTLPAIRTPGSPQEIRDMTRSFVDTTVQRRLEQVRFRNAVLKEWHERCAVCGPSVRALLDAARLDDESGIALCAMHRRAFDAKILRIDAQGIIHIHLEGHVGEAERAMLVAFDGKKGSGL